MKHSNPLILFGTGASSAKNYNDLMKICSCALENNITAFDTAPSYKTESVLGEIINYFIDCRIITRDKLFIQSKIDPIQMINKDLSIREHVLKTIDNMSIHYFDSILVHWPIPEFFAMTWDELQMLKDEGLVKNIGVCNVRTRHLNSLIKNGKPDIIQIERNPLNTCDEEVSFCHNNEIVVQAYSPLCKMHPDIKTNSLLIQLSKKYSKDIGEIVLRWHIDTGVAPVFTSQNFERINKYASILSFELEKNDVEMISKINRDYKIYLESWLCPGF